MSIQLSIVGQRKVRINGVDIVTGKAQFSTDVIRPNMLYGRILKSPYAHAKITAIDTSKAEALPGVKAVITYKDVPATAMYRSPTSLTPIVSDHYVLENEVRFVGDEVAAVAATDPFVAEEALDLIQVTYQQLPFVLTPEDALKSTAPLVHSSTTSNLLTTHSGTTKNQGDADATLLTSDKVVEIDGAVPVQIVASVDPHVAVVEWPAGGQLTMWDSTQCTYDRRNELSLVLGIPMNQIQVISDFCGVGFAESNLYRYTILAALLAKKAQRPVRLEPGKYYQFAGSSKRRHRASAHTKLGINNDGTLQAIAIDAVWDKGAYSSGGVVVTTPGGNMNLLYKLPTRYTYQTAETDNPPCGAFRGWGSPQACYFHERVINKACEDLGFDPVEVRSKAHIVTGFNGAASVGVEDCLRQGAAKFGWSSKWKPFKNKTDTGTVRSGVGCGIGVHTTGATTTNTSAAILMNRDGTAVLQTAASEMGTGVITVLAMIAAEELGAKLEDVSVDSGSSFLPECATQSATKTTHTLGKAVQLAADDLKQQLFTIAAGILGVSSSALSSKNSAIFVTADPTKTVAFKDVVAKGLRSIIGHGVRPATASPNHSEVYYADFVELQVDTETGDVNIVNFIAAHDVGKVVNLNTLENQVEGGTMEALGYSLAEEVVTDAASGVPLTCSYLNYGLYPVDQTPQLSVLFIESNDPYGPFGAKGIGEAPMNAPAATISSAIYNAIGKWIDPPFTPAKVLKALGKA